MPKWYTEETKIEAVRQVVEERKTVAQVARDFKITDKTIRGWVRGEGGIETNEHITVSRLPSRPPLVVMGELSEAGIADWVWKLKETIGKVKECYVTELEAIESLEKLWENATPILEALEQTGREKQGLLAQVRGMDQKLNERRESLLRGALATHPRPGD